MRHRAGLTLLMIAATLAGCGASGPSGKALFAEDCSSCHSLSGVQSPRRQGGDLLGAHFSSAVMLQFTRVMPTRRRLTPVELRTVAEYVVSVQRGGH
jgi:mono/diheme cytochrome c family protein